MKKIISKSIASLLIAFMLVMFANPMMSQPPPPPGGEHGEGTDKDPGGGAAPIEGGHYMLIGLAMGYGMYLVAKNRIGKLSFEKLEE